MKDATELLRASLSAICAEQGIKIVAENRAEAVKSKAAQEDDVTAEIEVEVLKDVGGKMVYEQCIPIWGESHRKRPRSSWWTCAIHKGPWGHATSQEDQQQWCSWACHSNPKMSLDKISAYEAAGRASLLKSEEMDGTVMATLRCKHPRCYNCSRPGTEESAYLTFEGMEAATRGETWGMKKEYGGGHRE